MSDSSAEECGDDSQERVFAAERIEKRRIRKVGLPACTILRLFSLLQTIYCFHVRAGIKSSSVQKLFSKFINQAIRLVEMVGYFVIRMLFQSSRVSVLCLCTASTTLLPLFIILILLGLIFYVCSCACTHIYIICNCL